MRRHYLYLGFVVTI